MTMPSIATTPEIDAALAKNAPVAIGVSGGKDSCAVALATIAYLDSVGHTGPRILIHSDLGRVEWRDSLATCERLADHLGLELVTVRRQAGDLLDRWRGRWQNNVTRYRNLECVKLILPWSTPAMRFCTSELKTAIICRELVRRFPGQTVLSVSGIRREESPKRAKAPLAAVQGKLASATYKTSGYDWHPIIDWKLTDVLGCLERHDVALHEAYTRYGSSRVSCAFCILASRSDLAASASCVENQDVYRAMVQLEIDSTFSFQDNGWLGDVAPHLLNDTMRDGLERAKHRATLREQAEACIPAHLLYTKGWPTCVPTMDEARLLAGVRWRVFKAVGFTGLYTQPADIIGRYEQLIAANAAKQRLPEPVQTAFLLGVS
jgi:3'-phosphoadenosine 5'-phosphosulfate sulfotransferase (PAPS reductase)/FAD synthetase